MKELDLRIKEVKLLIEEYHKGNKAAPSDLVLELTWAINTVSILAGFVFDEEPLVIGENLND